MFLNIETLLYMYCSKQDSPGFLFFVLNDFTEVVDIKMQHYRGEPSFVLFKSSPRNVKMEDESISPAHRSRA